MVTALVHAYLLLTPLRSSHTSSIHSWDTGATHGHCSGTCLPATHSIAILTHILNTQLGHWSYMVTALVHAYLLLTPLRSSHTSSIHSWDTGATCTVTALVHAYLVLTPLLWYMPTWYSLHCSDIVPTYYSLHCSGTYLPATHSTAILSDHQFQPVYLYFSSASERQQLGQQKEIITHNTVPSISGPSLIPTPFLGGCGLGTRLIKT